MKILLSCTECSFEDEGYLDREMMNKIIMWNHIQKEHPQTAAHILRVYQRVPASLFHMHAVAA